MNTYTIFDLEKFVNRRTHGVGVSQVFDFYGNVDDGRVQTLGKIRPPEWVRKEYLEQALYDQVDRYAIPEDLKYEDVIEIKKLSAKRNVDTMDRPLQVVYRRRFDQKRQGARNIMAIFNENGKKYAKIYNPRGIKECQNLTINEVESLDKDGTWNVGGNVVNLRIDKVNHISGKASLQFDINNSTTTGFIDNFTMRPKDISPYLETGAVFTWLSLSLPKELLAVKLTLGSNANDLTTDLFEFTVNQPHDSTSFTTDWNLLKSDIAEMNQIGNPNPKEIIYVRVSFTTTGELIPNCNLDNIVARKGVKYEITYNSRYPFIDANNGDFKMKASQGADKIMCEEDTWKIFALETTLSVQKEMYGNSAGAHSDVTDVKNELKEAYETYFKEHPSEALLQSDSIYIFGNMYDGLTDDPENWSNDYWWGDYDDNNQCGNCGNYNCNGTCSN